MNDSNDDSDRKSSSPKDVGKTKKNRSKLLANMIMKAKEKIRSNNSTNRASTGGSVTCLFDIRNKSRTSQSSKSKTCEDSDVGLEADVKSQPNLQKIDTISKESKESCRFMEGNAPASPECSLQKNNVTSSDTKDFRTTDPKNFRKSSDQNLVECMSTLSKCKSMAFISAAVKEVLDFTQRLQKSEEHLMIILKKYLKDNCLEKELTDIFTHHISLQIKAERHAQNLANDMWVQQAQFYKNQEKTFNDTLKEIMSQNQKLQEENEALSRRNEKIYIRMVLAQDDGSSCSREQSNLHIIEHLGKNNERLRIRNNQLIQKIKSLEVALADAKEQNSNVGKQLQNCFTDINNQKRIMQDFKVDKELEIATLNHKIGNSEKMFQNAIQQGEGVVEEIDHIKAKLSSALSSVNWIESRRSGNILVDIFFMCKFYIKEMAVCIEQLQNNVVILEEKNKVSKNECLKLRETLNLASVEIKSSIKQAEVYSVYAQERQEYIANTNILQKELEKYQQIIQSKTKSALEEREKMVKMIEGLELLKIKIDEKDEVLKKMQRENEGLKHQISGLNHVLRASGAGDVARELATAQAKLSELQSMYHQTMAEKNSLVEKVSSYSSKIETLSSNEASLNNKITDLENEIKSLKEAKCKVKEELSEHKSTLSVLQSERKRHLEEKNFLKAVYEKVKAEVVKAEGMENTIQVMTKETSRLSVIAEYNKQLGDKLQADIQEKDATITELQQDIRKLSELQKISLKEKAALCEELTEVCSFKDILSNKLEDEMTKNAKMSESRKMLESTVAKQLESMKSLQTIERNAVKELLCDFNEVLVQKNNLLDRENEYRTQIGKLEAELNDLKADLKILSDDKFKDEEKIVDLEKQLSQEKDKLSQIKAEKEKLSSDSQSLKTNNEKLQESLGYLKQNVQNMQSTIDHCKALEVELRHDVKKKHKELDKLKTHLEDSLTNLKAIQAENGLLTEKLATAKSEYDQMFMEYLNFKNKAVETENMQQNKINAMEIELKNSEQKISSMEIEIGQKTNDFLNMEMSLKSKENECENLKTEKCKLNDSIRSVTSEKEKLYSKALKLVNEVETLKIQLTAIQEKFEEKEKIYKKTLQELSYINDAQVADFREQINSFKSELKSSKERLHKEKMTYSQLEETHKDLAAKLLKAVHMLIDEKLSRQTAETKINQLTQEVIRRETEQVGAEQKISIYTAKLAEYENQIQELQEKIKSLEEDLKEMEEKYINQREQHEQLTTKCKDLEQRCIEQEDKLTSMANSLENEERIMGLKCEIDESHAYVMRLQNDIFKLQQDKTALEFERSEMELRLHDLQRQCQLEQDLKKNFENAHKRILGAVLEMKERGSLDRNLCNELVDVIQIRDSE